MPLSVAEEAAQLIAAITDSFNNGYKFYSVVEHEPLLTLLQIMVALAKDGEVFISEPPGQRNEILHQKEVKG